MENCTVINGHARFTSSSTVSVNGDLLVADRIFLNVGGRASVPDLPGLHAISYLTNSSILQLDTLPEHLAILGGSYIGLEFAQIFRRFGSRVTVFERSHELLPREDGDVSAAVLETLEKEGVSIHTGVDNFDFQQRGSDIVVSCGVGDEHTASHLLVATGRRPNTEDLGLEDAGVQTDARGYIAVDDELQTNVPGIWALGDCNGRGAFTHTAYNDFEIVSANLLDGDSRRVVDRLHGYALYTDPPLGRVGMTEKEALSSGRTIAVGTRSMARVGRAVEKGEIDGLMKIVFDAETREILGAAIFGIGGDEAIHGVVTAMSVGATADNLRWAVPIHPTVSELWPTTVVEANQLGPDKGGSGKIPDTDPLDWSED